MNIKDDFKDSESLIIDQVCFESGSDGVLKMIKFSLTEFIAVFESISAVNQSY